MPFRITNALEVITNLMNYVYTQYLDKFITVFTDNILVYSKSKEEHVEYLKIVLHILKKHKLYGQISKYKFWFEKLLFLGIKFLEIEY